ncbi:MAG: class I SAM-dependent methyltransferase [Leptospira sp.]|nr:class I SAM-dependent methyltransferase [Leptospira sp.]
MSLFNFVPHTLYPKEYDICQNTSVLRYKLAKHRMYGDSYFMEEYKSQYKKTYYEDEVNLRNMAIRRLRVIQKILSTSKSKKLLEIGSAAGFFLDEAKKLGFQTKGLELSKREVDYSAIQLGLDVEQKSVLDIPVGLWNSEFDLLSAFFVVEHIAEIDAIWTRLSSWIKPGGILFLALPSSFGPSFTTNPTEWFRTHPEDHFFDYDVRSLKKLLSILGFELKYVRPMSYHPHRDKSFLGRLPGWLYRIYSKIACYGDTIEVAAQKKYEV